MSTVFGESYHGVFMVHSESQPEFETIEHNVGAVVYGQELKYSEFHAINFDFHASNAVKDVVHVEVPVKIDSSVYVFPDEDKLLQAAASVEEVLSQSVEEISKPDEAIVLGVEEKPVVKKSKPRKKSV